MEPAMGKLVPLLYSDDPRTQEMALSAVAGVVETAGIDFLPYAQTVCEILCQLSSRTEYDKVGVTSRAIQTLGLVARAIGEPNFALYLDQGVRAATQMLASSHNSLKGNACYFIADCSAVMKRSMGRYLSVLVPLVSKVVQDSKVRDSQVDEDGFVMSCTKLQQTALAAIEALLEHTDELYYPYFEVTMAMLLAGADPVFITPDNEIRGEVFVIIQRLLLCCGLGNGLNLRDKPKTGQMLVLPPQVYECARVLMNSYILAMYHDGDVFPVTCACDGVSFVLESIGAVALRLPQNESMNMLAFLKGATQLLFTEKAPCQQLLLLTADGGIENDEYNDLLDSAGDMVGVLSKVVGTECISFFDDVCNQLILLMEPNKSDRNREMVFRCFCDVINSIGAESVRYVDILIPVILRGLVDPSSAVRRNSAYCTGILIEFTGEVLLPHYPQLLGYLFPLCVRSESSETGGMTDNALAAVARMITTNSSAVQLPQAVPLILSNLPLIEDDCEGFPIFSCLLTLAKRNEPTVMGLLNDVIPAFGEVLSRSAVDEVATDKVAEEFFLFLSNSDKQEMKDCFMVYLSELEDQQLRLKIEGIIQAGNSKKKCCIS